MKDDEILPDDSTQLPADDPAHSTAESSADNAADDPADDEDDYSLEDLGAAYARAMAESGLLPQAPEQSQQDVPHDHEPSTATNEADVSPIREDDGEGGISPLSIVEGALFIGHPENKPLTASQIAGTMRGVSAEEVEEIIRELNDHYQKHGHAFWIAKRDDGYVLGISEEMRTVRAAFYGKIRETRLNQAAIDVLALVAYQPGITSVTITEQRGKDSGPIVNQMVRRELLEMRREPREDGKLVPSYYPSARLLNLLGLRSLDDLPQVDEADISPHDL